MERLNLLLTKGPSLVFCNFKTKEIVKKTKKSFPIECHYSLDIEIDPENEELSAALSAHSDSEGIPFDFDVKSKAVFKIPKLNVDEIDKELIEKRAISEVIPYIFPFLKEMVADLTRKAYLKPFYLPSIELNIEKFEHVENK